jgi:hypothetical protein
MVENKSRGDSIFLSKIRRLLNDARAKTTSMGRTAGSLLKFLVAFKIKLMVWT